MQPVEDKFYQFSILRESSQISLQQTLADILQSLSEYIHNHNLPIPKGWTNFSERLQQRVNEEHELFSRLISNEKLINSTSINFMDMIYSLKDEIISSLDFQPNAIFFLQEFINGILNDKTKFADKFQELMQYLGKGIPNVIDIAKLDLQNKIPHLEQEVKQNLVSFLLSNKSMTLREELKKAFEKLESEIDQVNHEITVDFHDYSIRMDEAMNSIKKKVDEDKLAMNQQMTSINDNLIKRIDEIQATVSSLSRENSTLKTNYGFVVEKNKELENKIKTLEEKSEKELTSLNATKYFCSNLAWNPQHFITKGATPSEAAGNFGDIIKATKMGHWNMDIDFDELCKIGVSVSDQVEMCKEIKKILTTSTKFKCENLTLRCKEEKVFTNGIVNMLDGMKDLVAFKFDLSGSFNSFDQALKLFCSKIESMKQLKKLTFNFSGKYNFSSGSGIENLCNCLKGMKNLSRLTVDLRDNPISIKQIELLEKIQKNVKECTILFDSFGFKFTSNFNADIKLIQNLLQVQKQIASLNLDFSSNPQANDANLSQLIDFITNPHISISNLTLDLRNNAISSNQLHILKALSAINKNYQILFDFIRKLSSDYNNELKKLSDQLKNVNQIGKIELDATNINNGYNKDYEMIKSIHNAINQFQCIKHLIITKFSHQPRESGKNEDVGLLALVFNYTQSITHLQLNFNQGSVTNKAFEALANSINQMNLNSSKNTFKNLDLRFCSGSNGINDDGAEKLAVALENMKSLASLTLYFWGGNNCIGDRGIQKIAEALQNMTDLTNLDLQLNGGKNNISDVGLKHLATALSKITASLTFTFFIKHKISFYDNSNQGVTENGLRCIKEALKYKSLEIDMKQII